MSRPRRVRRYRHRASKIADQGPTPETLRKLKPDVVARLHQAGALHQDHVNAAEAIRDVWAALQSTIIGGAAYGLVAGRSGIIGDPVSRMTGREAALWARVWKPWADELGRMVRSGRDGPAAVGRVTVLQLVLDVVCDNIAPTSEPMLAAVKAGLDRWCAIDREGRRERGKRRPAGGAA